MTMLSNETVRKLQEMHLGVMAEAFSTQLQDSQFQTVSFEDRFAMLVDAEWSARKSNRLTRLIRNAGYADPAACVENIEYLPERKLDREQILRLASCTYLQEAHNVIILGATGAGKTYLACALGMAASRSFYSVRYIRLPDLLGPGQRNLPGLHEKAQERETAYFGRVAALSPQGGRGPGCAGTGRGQEQGGFHHLLFPV